MSTLNATDLFAVERNGVLYKLANEDMSTVNDTDLFVVERGGTNYKVEAQYVNANTGSIGTPVNVLTPLNGAGLNDGNPVEPVSSAITAVAGSGSTTFASSTIASVNIPSTTIGSLTVSNLWSEGGTGSSLFGGSYTAISYTSPATNVLSQISATNGTGIPIEVGTKIGVVGGSENSAQSYDWYVHDGTNSVLVGRTTTGIARSWNEPENGYIMSSFISDTAGTLHGFKRVNGSEPTGFFGIYINDKRVVNSQGVDGLPRLTFPNSNNFDKFSVGDEVQTGVSITSIDASGPTIITGAGGWYGADASGQAAVSGDTRYMPDDWWVLTSGGSINNMYKAFDGTLHPSYTASSQDGQYLQFELPTALDGTFKFHVKHHNNNDDTVDFWVYNASMGQIGYYRQSNAASNSISTVTFNNITGAKFLRMKCIVTGQSDKIVHLAGIEHNSKLFKSARLSGAPVAQGETSFSKTVSYNELLTFTDNTNLDTMVAPIEMTDSTGAVVSPTSSTITNIADISAWNQSTTWGSVTRSTNSSGTTSGSLINVQGGPYTGGGLNARCVCSPQDGYITVDLPSGVVGAIEVIAQSDGIPPLKVYSASGTEKTLANTDARQFVGFTQTWGSTFRLYTGDSGGGPVLKKVFVGGQELVNSGVSGAPSTGGGFNLTVTNTDNLSLFSAGDKVQDGSGGYVSTPTPSSSYFNPGNAFDGNNSSTYVQLGSAISGQLQKQEWNFNPAISCTSLRLRLSAPNGSNGTYGNDIVVNSSAVTNQFESSIGTSTNWYTITGHGNSISKISLNAAAGYGGGLRLYAVEINGNTTLTTSEVFDTKVQSVNVSNKKIRVNNGTWLGSDGTGTTGGDTTVVGPPIVATSTGIAYHNGNQLAITGTTGTYQTGFHIEGAQITDSAPSASSIVFTSSNAGSTAFSQTNAQITNRTWTLESATSVSGPYSVVGVYVDTAANSSQDGSTAWSTAPTLAADTFFKVKVKYNSNNADSQESSFNTFKTSA